MLVYWCATFRLDDFSNAIFGATHSKSSLKSMWGNNDCSFDQRVSSEKRHKHGLIKRKSGQAGWNKTGSLS
jgi:hypothetical protein